MKKFICFILVSIMLFASLSITASAADTPKSAYRVDWSALGYNAYWYNEKKDDISKYFTVSATQNSIVLNAKGKSERRAYVAKTRFEITADTKYEYVFQAKNNRDYGYCGVVFAFADGLPYFVYGSFNNVSDEPNDGKCDIRVNKGLNQHDTNPCGAGFTRSFVTVDTDSENYGTFKVAFDGLNVTVYALTDAEKGTYEPVGNAITLPSGAKIALGVYNRESSGTSDQRTISVKNAVLYAMNDAAAEKLGSMSDGSFELLSYVADIEKKYSEVDFDKESYSALANALDAAKKLVNSGTYIAAQISSARSDIDSAVVLLQYAEPDFTALEELVTKAEALNESDCDADAYKALMDSVDAAKALIEKTDARQSEVNAALTDLTAKYEAAVPAENENENGNAPEGSESTPTETQDSCLETLPYTDIATDTGIVPQLPATDEIPEKSGCKSVALGSSILCVAALLGVSAFIVKKKED